MLSAHLGNIITFRYGRWVEYLKLLAGRARAVKDQQEAEKAAKKQKQERTHFGRVDDSQLFPEE